MLIAPRFGPLCIRCTVTCTGGNVKVGQTGMQLPSTGDSLLDRPPPEVQRCAFPLSGPNFPTCTDHLMSTTEQPVQVEATRANERHEIVRLEVQTVQSIARGGWSQVTLVDAKWGSGPNVVVQRLVRKRARQPVAFKHRELEVHQDLKHPNIVKVEGWWYEMAADHEAEHGENVRYLNLLLSPYCPQTLNDVKGELSERLLLLFAQQLFGALEYLHAPERSVAHRDLKAENILIRITAEAEGQGHLQMYLCDFGCAKRILPTEQNGVEVGEPKTRAPEMLRQSGFGTYTTAVDIYAAGLLLFYALLGRDLVPARPNQQEQLLEYERVFGHAKTASEIISLIESESARDARPTPSQSVLQLLADVLTPDVNARPEAQELVRRLKGL
ncbi:kinase-like domain-containing protein [Kockovaella imperatae]|uniref:non-specific serine/threonine protein kinase n=1 Tax=Kockovaella imperatae TaxID=4999 RepID=A0A1Y1U950_9TREE|nr:kinase-like domain-containing protein [Kockovaella imperatae]ORX33625.1 kinase-like domain-containing protein [Kockovaella imperatae]